jgi:DNA polymerase-1
MSDRKKCLLIDGSSFLYRAFYALRPLYTTQGQPVGAVFGFCRMVKKLLDTQKPEYVMVVWDSKGKTVRHEMYADYKATRQAPPQELFSQKELIQEFLTLIGMVQVSKTGIEADDLMYSLSLDFAHHHHIDCLLVTGDKDMGQAVSDHCFLYDPFKDLIINQEVLEQKYGFSLDKLPFYYALIGDSSDNIPGVKGIGPKGAQKLVSEYNGLEDLYEKIDKVSSVRTQQLLRDYQEQAFLSYKLFLLHRYTLDLSLETAASQNLDWYKSRDFLVKYEFTSLVKELDKKYGAVNRVQEHTMVQASCFGPSPEAVQHKVLSNYMFFSVTTIAQLHELVESIKKVGACALDTETDGLNTRYAQLIGISLCCQDGCAYYIPCGHVTDEQQLSRQELLDTLGSVLADKKIKKYMHNAKFDLEVLNTNGFTVCGLAHDSMIAASLVVREGQRVGLKELSQIYLHETMHSFKEVVLDKGYKSFAQVPIAKAVEYAAADAHQTWQLTKIFYEQLCNSQQLKLFEDIELPLIFSLMGMELEGIDLNADKLLAIGKEVEHLLKQVVHEIHKSIGKHDGTINLNSPKQLSQLLFDELKLVPGKKTAGRTSYSTDQEVLEELASQHEVPVLILRYRELFKLKSTYIDSLLEVQDKKTGRIYTSFSQISTATGRLASSEPNLQNIPVETPGLSHQIRSAFHAPRGCSFLSADYSQIELRVLAYFSQDERLLKAFKHGHDIHAQTAAGLFDVDLDKVTHAQRQMGKRINFSILYGLTPYGLSKDLKIPLADAKKYIDKYFAHYPGVVAWMETVVQETKKNGFVTTFFGRRRQLPGIHEQNKTLYDLARRTAINTKAQGTAAEIMKIGMIQVYQALKKDFCGARLILQIHDELLLTVPDDIMNSVEKKIKEILEHVVDWDVPLTVTTRTGKDWHEVTK